MQQRASRNFDVATLLVAICACIAAFLPFSAGTSAWSAVTLRVPGDQGNWWHFIAGAPFFLAFIMVWLSARSLLSFAPSAVERRIFWGLAGASVCGTLLVEGPVLFRMGNFAQMGLYRQMQLVVPGLCALALCTAILVSQRSRITSADAILVGLCAAYLTHAAFCLGMYAPYAPQSGWYVTMALVWLLALLVLWVFFHAYRMPDSPAVVS